MNSGIHIRRNDERNRKKKRPKKSVNIWHILPAMLGTIYEAKRVNVKYSPY